MASTSISWECSAVKTRILDLFYLTRHLFATKIQIFLLLPVVSLHLHVGGRMPLTSMLNGGDLVGWNSDARSAAMGSEDFASSAEINVPKNHRRLEFCLWGRISTPASSNTIQAGQWIDLPGSGASARPRDRNQPGTGISLYRGIRQAEGPDSAYTGASASPRDRIQLIRPGGCPCIS